METSIIMLTYNHLGHTRCCIESIRKYTAGISYEVIVIDNNSTDGTRTWLKEQKDIVCILNPWNYGRAKAINQGIGAASGNNILILNSGAFVTPNWLENLTCCLYSSSYIGAVGPITNENYNSKDTNLTYENIPEAQEFPKGFNGCNPGKWVGRDRLSSFCVLVNRKVINEVGLLDERYFPEYYEADDYFLRMKLAGYRAVLCMDTFIYSQREASLMEEDSTLMDIRLMNKEKFEIKWNNKYEEIFR